MPLVLVYRLHDPMYFNLASAFNTKYLDQLLSCCVATSIASEPMHKWVLQQLRSVPPLCRILREHVVHHIAECWREASISSTAIRPTHTGRDLEVCT